jgi:N6-L-threonylcarbamoyladenine synthase
MGPLEADDVDDLAAALQEAIGDCLVDRTRHAIAMCPNARTLVAAGGVAANQNLRTRLQRLAAEQGLSFVAPSPRLCTDNAAMIGWAGIERLRLGLVDSLDFAPRPRWPLDPAAAPALGAGIKA